MLTQKTTTHLSTDSFGSQWFSVSKAAAIKFERIAFCNLASVHSIMWSSSSPRLRACQARLCIYALFCGPLPKLWSLNSGLVIAFNSGAVAKPNAKNNTGDWRVPRLQNWNHLILRQGREEKKMPTIEMVDIPVPKKVIRFPVMFRDVCRLNLATELRICNTNWSHATGRRTGREDGD